MSDYDSRPGKEGSGGYRKTPFSWVWVAATAALCVVFFLALVPVAAQGASSPNAPGGLSQNAQARRYPALIQNVFDFIQRNYIREVEPNTLFEGAMRGMFEALDDPYSAFMPRNEMQALRHTTQGSFGGVGLYITPGRGSYVEVAAPIEGTPGWRAGINPGDLIIEIDGESTAALSMDAVLARLRGQVGQDVELVIRRGESLEFPVTLTRAVIEVPTTRHAMIGNTGYLRLTSFTPMTAARAREAVEYFESHGFTSMILDLRNNSGGLLTAAVEVSSLFLDGGVVVRTRSRIPSENRDFNTTAQMAVPADIPVVVLINRGSASASEIVAGALKDRGRAFLVGEHTFGKGSVQQVFPLGDAGFRITTARYYSPSDASIDIVGIPPDLLVRPPQYSDADVASLAELMRTARIASFVNANPNAAAASVDAFAQEIIADFGLPEPLVRRLIRTEQNRTVIAPIVDLEYDIQLVEALHILESDMWHSLMPTRTLRSLQDEREEQEMALAS